MVNDPVPWQMTVAKFRSVLEEADPDAVVCLEVPAGGIGNPELATFLSVQVRDRDQSLVSSRIWKITADPTGWYWPVAATQRF